MLAAWCGLLYSEMGLPEEVRFHSLLDTYVSLVRRKGMLHFALQLRLGHSSVKTTETYASLDDAFLREAVKRMALLDERLGGLLTPLRIF
jgi:integrase